MSTWTPEEEAALERALDNAPHPPHDEEWEIAADVEALRAMLAEMRRLRAEVTLLRTLLGVE